MYVYKNVYVYEYKCIYILYVFVRAPTGPEGPLQGPRAPLEPREGDPPGP